LFVLTVGHFCLGTYVYTVIKARAGGVYFEPVPGAIAMVLFNFALREPKVRRMWLWVLLLAPALLHQFLSFTRGFWLAILVGFVFSTVVYIGRGDGMRLRMKRTATLLGAMGGSAVVGVVILAGALHIGSIGTMAANRFASSTGTKGLNEAASNVVRLVEYAHVLEDIIEQPWFGHGLGFKFVVREPLNNTLVEQWFTHENYLLVTLKQGLLGLAIWLWLLFSLIRTGLRGRNLPNVTEQSWCTGAAAFMVFCAAYSLVHFPLAEVNTTFPLALVLGAAMRMTATGNLALRWKGRRTLESA